MYKSKHKIIVNHLILAIDCKLFLNIFNLLLQIQNYLI